jgi:DNA primase
MDVIAGAGGLRTPVAPLGTALTEDQVRLLWRMVPEPILCFDGDAAGRRAAFRAVETVLPHLKPGFSVQFAFLPDGLDPDDLVRQHGAAAFKEILENRTSPLFDVLIQREEQQGEPAVTPEQRASLEARLQALVARIGDRGVRDQYERELRETLWAKNRKLMRGIAGSKGRRDAACGQAPRQHCADWRVGAGHERSRVACLAPARSLRLPCGATSLPADRSRCPREALLIQTLLNHPWLLEAHCETVAELTLTAPPLARLRDALLELLAQNIALDRGELRSQLTELGLDKVVAMAEGAITHRSDKFAEPEAEAPDVEVGWRHAVALHEAQVGLKGALAAAEREWQAAPTEEAWDRIAEIQQRLARGIEAEGTGEE